MEELFRSFNKYRLGFAFNGGKESTIIFDMILKYLPNTNIKYFYIPSKTDFSEITTFIDEIIYKYNIKLLTYPTTKDAIIKLKQSFNINAILMGSRKTDPNCFRLDVVSETDSHYPKILLNNPIINWSYKDVWNYIEQNNVKVCSLYEKGYTSIGTKSNTFPNYSLFKDNKYLHGKYLTNETVERIGRIEFDLPISLSGKVIKGEGRGKNIGVPTANLEIYSKASKTLKTITQDGVYYGKCNLNGNIDLMVMSVGKNVHFNSKNKTLEVHILKTFDYDFYEKELKIEILGYIRPMEKYSCVEKLKKAIDKDIQIAKYLSV